MKFYPQHLTKLCPRLGLISDIDRLPEIRLPTPMAIFYTKGGNIPHITHEVLQHITQEQHSVQVPLATSKCFYESLENTDKTLSEFIGLKEHLLYLTVQDPAEISPNGHHLQNNIPIWTRSGKCYINSDSYMDIVEAFQPDMYCLLSDGDTNRTSSNKRILKAVDHTVSFMRKCLDRHKKSDRLKNSTVIACIEGGYSIHSRDYCIKETLKEMEHFGGFLINGLHNNGPERELLSFNDIKPVVEHVINSLPENKLRIIEGCWTPKNVIKLTRLGVDLFDTSYPSIVTHRTSALTFDFTGQRNPTPQENEIDLGDSKYAEDFGPVLQNCSCLTCRKYSRAYIHHLINVQELLAPILLTIHNIHHYLEFFKKIRLCIEEGTMENLEKLIDKQFDVCQKPKKDDPQIINKVL